MFNRRPSVGPDDERNALAAEWRGLVPWFLRRLACTSFVRRHYHDLLSAGNMALIRAASLWRPERGAKFQSYAVHWIRGGVAKELRRLRSRRVRLFIDLSPDDNNDDDFAFDPAAPVPEEQAPTSTVNACAWRWPASGRSTPMCSTVGTGWTGFAHKLLEMAR
jgi:RNA polymerase sigma factor (sigma-70 family)